MKTNYKWFERFNELKFFSNNDIEVRELIVCMSEQTSLASQLIHQMDELYASAVMDGFGLLWDFYNDEAHQKAEFRGWMVDGGDDLPSDWHPSQTGEPLLVLRAPTKVVFDNTEDNPNVLKLSGAIERIQFSSQSKKHATQALAKAAQLPESPAEVNLTSEQLGERTPKKDLNAKPLTNEEVQALMQTTYSDEAMKNALSLEFFNFETIAHREVLMQALTVQAWSVLPNLVSHIERAADRRYGETIQWKLNPSTNLLSGTQVPNEVVFYGQLHALGKQPKLIGEIHLTTVRDHDGKSLRWDAPCQWFPKLDELRNSPEAQALRAEVNDRLDMQSLPGWGAQYGRLRAYAQSLADSPTLQGQVSGLRTQGAPYDPTVSWSKPVVEEITKKMQAITPTQYLEELKALECFTPQQHEEAVRRVIVNNFVFNNFGQMFGRVEKEVGDYLDRERIEGASILWRFDYSVGLAQGKFNCYAVALDEEDLMFELVFKLFPFASPFSDQRKRAEVTPYVVGLPLVRQTNCIPTSEFYFKLNNAGWLGDGTLENIPHTAFGAIYPHQAQLRKEAKQAMLTEPLSIDQLYETREDVYDRRDVLPTYNRNGRSYPSTIYGKKNQYKPFRDDGEPMTIDQLYETREDRFKELDFAQYSSMWEGVRNIANMPYFSLRDTPFREQFVENFIDVSPHEDRPAEVFLEQLRNAEQVWRQGRSPMTQVLWSVEEVTRHPNDLRARFSMMVEYPSSQKLVAAYQFDVQLRYDWPEGCGNPAVKFTEFVPDQWNLLIPGLVNPLLIANWGGFEPTRLTNFHNLAPVDQPGRRYGEPLRTPKIWNHENSGLMANVFSSNDDSATVHFTSYAEVKHLFENMQVEVGDDSDQCMALLAMTDAIKSLEVHGKCCFTIEAVGPKGGDAATILLRAMMKQGGACLFTAQLSIIAKE